MNKQDILKKIGEILCDEAMINDPSELKMETGFKEDLDMDSLEMIDFVNTMEEEFGVKIDDSQLTHVIRAEDAVNMVVKLKSEK